MLSAASAVFVRDACGPDVYCQSPSNRLVYTQRDDAFYETENMCIYVPSRSIQTPSFCHFFSCSLMLNCF